MATASSDAASPAWRKLQSAYKRLDLTATADHIFFLRYGGVVLMSAIERLNARGDCLFLWGIDEGPCGQLAKTSAAGVERLTTLKTP